MFRMEEQPREPYALPAGGNTLNTAYHNSKHDSSSHHHDNTYNSTHHHYHATEGHLKSSKRAQDRLEEYVSKGAAHDSAERGTDAPKCFPETREAVQGEMLSFVDPGGEEKMLWLSGPAGAGKTAIMGSICDECYARGWLAGSFFFSTSVNKVDRCSSRYLIPTLAYHFFQLNIPGLPAAILASIDANPSVFDKRLDQQVEILLLRPLREVCQTVDPSMWPKVVVVDGIDECSAEQGRTYETEPDRQRSKEENHREVLSALTQASNDPAFPFRVLIASRPERAIERYFATLRGGPTKKIFLDNKYSPETDIKLYARAMLTKIGLDHGLGGGWFAQVGLLRGMKDVPQYLAKESSGQFAYVATVTRFIQGNSDTPHKQLERVLNWRRSDTSKPFAALDALYTGILSTSPKPIEAALFIHASQELPHPGGWYLHAVLQSSQGQIRHVLGPLSSLVRITDGDGKPDFHLYHKSLSDFLEDPGRSGELHVGMEQVDGFISGRYYAILKNRGPQVPILGSDTIGRFLSWFCGEFPGNFLFTRGCKYTAEDVDWWLGDLASITSVAHAYYKVHEECRWHTCQPTCKVWRKGILRYAKANGWRVPTLLEELQDRVKPFPYYGTDSRGIKIQDILHPPQEEPESITWSGESVSDVPS